MRVFAAYCVASLLLTAAPAVGAELAFSTYFGGRSVDDVRAVAVDDEGAVYVVGRTSSSDFAVSEGMDEARPGLAAAFVAKIAPGGAAVEWARYFGGDAFDAANGVAVDGDGLVHVVGTTSSTNLAVSEGAAQGSYGGAGAFLEGDAFYARFDGDDGSLLYATYFGGSGDEEGHDVAADGAGGAWIVGISESEDLPQTNAFEAGALGDDDAFVVHYDAEGAVLLASAFGGSGADEALAVVATGTDRAAIVGQTRSPDFPEVGGLGGTVDGTSGFVVRVSGTTLASATTLGGTRFDVAYDVAVDSAGNLVVVGETTSEDFPVRDALQRAYASPVCNDLAGCSDGFVTSLRPAADGINWSTYLGGGHKDSIFGVAVDDEDAVTIVGRTQSVDFPVVRGFQLESAGGDYVEGFAARLSADGERIVGATYLGGRTYDEALAVTADANTAWIVGQTQSADFPTRLPLVDAIGGVADGFVVQVAWGASGPLRLYSIEPALGGDAGWLTALVRGNGIPEDVEVRLTRAGEEELVPVEQLADATGTLVGVRFDLRGRARGGWSLSLASEDDEVTLADAFAVVAGGGPDVVCDLVGPGTVAWDTETLFYVRYQNQGLNDAEYVACNLVLPPDTEVAFGPPPPVAPDPYAPDQPVADQPAVIELPDSVNAPTIVPNVPPHWDVFVPVRLTFPRAGAETGRVFPETQTMGPLIDGDQIFTDIMDCLLSVNSELVNIADVVAPFSPACLTQAASYVGSNLRGNGPGVFFSGEVSYGTMAQIGLGAFGAAANCVAQRENPVGQLTGFANVVLGAADVWDQCGEALPWIGLLLLALSVDPNDIEGPLGVGEARYVPPDQHFAYRVRFENLDEATAPAQRVVVTVPIDSALDLDSFRFGEVFVQEQRVALRTDPEDRDRAAGVLDMRTAEGVVATVEARLDREAGEAVWAFQAIDPLTGAPPTNPFFGFLPPNEAPPEGEGALFFSLEPLADALAPGDVVAMQAAIVFDENATIETNVWENTVIEEVPNLRPVSEPEPDAAPDMGADADDLGDASGTGDDGQTSGGDGGGGCGCAVGGGAPGPSLVLAILCVATVGRRRRRA